MGRPGRIRGIGVKSGGIGGGKQPKTCVWISAVGGRAFLQRSQNANFDLTSAHRPGS